MAECSACCSSFDRATGRHPEPVPRRSSVVVFQESRRFQREEGDVVFFIKLRNNKQNRIAERENGFPPMFLIVNVFVSDGPPPVNGFTRLEQPSAKKAVRIFIGFIVCASDIDLRTLIYIDTLTPPRNFRQYHTYHENNNLVLLLCSGCLSSAESNRPGRTHPGRCRTAALPRLPGLDFSTITPLAAIDKTAGAGAQVIELYSAKIQPGEARCGFRSQCF